MYSRTVRLWVTVIAGKTGLSLPVRVGNQVELADGQGKNQF